jgi:hypothetical protein
LRSGRNPGVSPSTTRAAAFGLCATKAIVSLTG